MSAPRGVPGPGGVCSTGGVPGPRGGFTWSRGCLLQGGLPGPRGMPGPGGVVWSGGCVVSQHALRQTPHLWTDRQV